MSIAARVAAGFVILFLVAKLHRRLFTRGPKSYLPYDLVGIIFPAQIFLNFRRRTLLSHVQRLLQRYSGTFVVNILGRDYLFTHDVHNIQHILKLQFHSFSVAADRTHLFQPLSTRGVLTLDGEAWHASREQLRRQFSQQRAMVDLDMHERHIQNLIEKLRLTHGEKINLKDYFVSLVQDSHSEFVLGRLVGSLAVNQPSERIEFSKLITYTTDTLAKKGFAGPFHWLVGRHRFIRTCAVLNRYIEKYVFQALGQRGSAKEKPTMISTSSFIHCLTATETDPISLRDQASNVLFAGVDSMTSTLNSTLWLLARDEKVYRKLRQEVLEICGQEPPSYDQIKRLKYLRYVLSEVLRLYPPVPLDIRTAIADTTLPRGAGLDGLSTFPIKKGQHIVFSSFSAHRQPDMFGEDCLDFRPERWDEIKPNSIGYLPFHIGPRSCVGQHYALTVLSYTIARIAQSFKAIKSQDDRNWKEQLSMTLGNENEVFVSLFQS